MKEIRAQELHDWLQDPDRPNPLLLDVREPNEFSAFHIEGSTLLPMNTIPERMGEFDRSSEIILICSSGVRSHHSGLFLERNGFAVTFNLVGGIEAWLRDIQKNGG